MGNLPLHPIVVHFPLVFAMILPIVGLAVLWGQRRQSLGPRAWWIVAITAGILAASSFVALKTGEREEDRVEEVVGEDAIHTHEERAESLIWLAAATFAVAVLAGVTRSKLRVALSVGSVGLAVAAMVAAVLVGDSGGKLVYEHGAAAAYTSSAVDYGGVAERQGDPGQRGRDRDDDDDDRERRR